MVTQPMRNDGLRTRSVVAGAAGALLVMPGADASGVGAGAVVGLLLGGLAGWVAGHQTR